MRKNSLKTGSVKGEANATSSARGTATPVKKSTQSKYVARYNAAMDILSDITKSEIASINAITARILSRAK